MSARNCLALVLLFVVAVIVGMSNLGEASSRAQTAKTVSAVPITIYAGDHGFDLSNMDTTASACTNFFQYAAGGWVARTEIPAAYPSWGLFAELSEKNREHMRDILEAAAKKKSKPGSNEQKISDFYTSCMDEAGAEAAGLKAIEPELNRIKSIDSKDTLQSEVARLQSRGVGVVFRFGSGQDFKDATKVIGQMGQSGLSLPDRDYYLENDDSSKKLREKFPTHIAKMFQLAGDDEATATAGAATVMTIETKLATASMNRIVRRKPENVYHKMTVAQVKAMAPNIDWDAYFKTVGLSHAGDINVGQPDFMKAVSDYLTSIPIADWKTYLRWHVINAAAPTLSSKFVDEDFDFNGRTLNGTKEILPRWKRCVAATDRALGEALGQEYVKRYFTAESKARALQMVQNLIAALHDDLTTLSWMSDPTRQRAIAKLGAFAKKIGYPDKWRDYSALKIGRTSYAENATRARLFAFNYGLNKIAKPVDRTEWGMTPPTVNAQYNSSLNDITFPAGILQPPFYDPSVDDAINYGGIGAVIGHEMTHGFDDNGAKFDGDGNLLNWWTDADLKNFQARTQCVIDQFDSYEAQPGVHEKGELVVGESIADLGGLTVAYAALQKALAGKPRPAIDGFTPEQRFFLGWAQVWTSKARPQFELNQVKTDAHPLGRFRVIGPLSNMPAFAQAFQCKAGDAMVRPPDKRCQIW